MIRKKEIQKDSHKWSKIYVTWNEYVEINSPEVG